MIRKDAVSLHQVLSHTGSHQNKSQKNLNRLRSNDPHSESHNEPDPFVFIMEKISFQNGVLAAAGVECAKNVESTQWTKYHATRAHGFSAEDYNALIDRLCGKTVDKVGLNNELNGADRIVDGVKIQSKYCSSAYESVRRAFDANGTYRYPGMKLEVPKGQGEDAIRYIEERIRNGQVPGVSDPSMAREMVIEGKCTYEQALKIAKAGNLESIKFDAMNQMVSCACVAGLSFVIGYAVSRLGGLSRKAALHKAIGQAGRTGAITMAAGVAVQQMLRTQVGRSMAAMATNTARKGVDCVMRTPAGAAVIEKMMVGFMGKAATQGAARNACIKLLRSNFFTSAAVAIASTVPDTVKACRGKKSWKQVGKNAVVNVAGIGSGSAGWWAGAAAGSCIFPGIGTVIGGFVGAVGGGIVGSIGAKKAMDLFVDDDANLCIKYTQDAILELCLENNISEEELSKIMRKIHSKNVLRESFFENMYRAGGKCRNASAMKDFARKGLSSYFS